MNILPKKRWHVRTKDNIARVRRDEAKAAEELKEVERRSKLADQEARTNYLRNQARLKFGGGASSSVEVKDAFADGGGSQVATSSGGHVNFFQDLESGETTMNVNKDREEEKKKEQEEYEKKIGLLTYLGQDSQELTGDKSWWQQIPDKRDQQHDDQKLADKKQRELDLSDPMRDVRDYMGCKGMQKIVQENVGKKRRNSGDLSEFGSKREKRRKKHKKDGRKHKKRHDSDSSDDGSRKRKKKRKKHDSDNSDDGSKKRKKKRKKHDSDSDESFEGKRKKKRQRLDSNDDGESFGGQSEAEKRKKLERLRQERLEREKRERARTDELLYGKKAESVKRKIGEMSEKELVKSQQKYNNQFNPQLAKQNRLDASKKYWLE